MKKKEKPLTEGKANKYAYFCCFFPRPGKERRRKKYAEPAEIYFPFAFGSLGFALSSRAARGPGAARSDRRLAPAEGEKLADVKGTLADERKKKGNSPVLSSPRTRITASHNIIAALGGRLLLR